MTVSILSNAKHDHSFDLITNFRLTAQAKFSISKLPRFCHKKLTFWVEKKWLSANRKIIKKFNFKNRQQLSFYKNAWNFKKAPVALIFESNTFFLILRRLIFPHKHVQNTLKCVASAQLPACSLHAWKTTKTLNQNFL